MGTKKTFYEIIINDKKSSGDVLTTTILLQYKTESNEKSEKDNNEGTEGNL